MPSLTPRVVVTGDRMIQFGYARKNAVESRVNFARPFSAPPRVVLTPLWEDAGREVGHAETLGSIAQDHFVLFSNNAAPNYFVAWIAVGYLRGSERSDNVNYVVLGDLIIEAGRTPKATVSVSPSLGYPFAHPPNIQVSPFWEGQRSGVGHAETLSRVEPRVFDVFSDNRAANYSVSWIAAGTLRPDLPPREMGSTVLSRGWFYSDFVVNEWLFRTMRGPLRSGGGQNISIGVPPFAAPPVVVVTPFWEGQRRGVGHAETLDRVEPHFLRLAGDNGAENSFVSILAIGPR